MVCGVRCMSYCGPLKAHTKTSGDVAMASSSVHANASQFYISLDSPLTPTPTPSAINPQPSTLNPQPSTLYPQPSTLSPRPQNLNPEHQGMWQWSRRPSTRTRRSSTSPSNVLIITSSTPSMYINGQFRTGGATMHLHGRFPSRGRGTCI